MDGCLLMCLAHPLTYAASDFGREYHKECHSQYPLHLLLGTTQVFIQVYRLRSGITGSASLLLTSGVEYPVLEGRWGEGRTHPIPPLCPPGNSLSLENSPTSTANGNVRWENGKKAVQRLSERWLWHLGIDQQVGGCIFSVWAVLGLTSWFFLPPLE